MKDIIDKEIDGLYDIICQRKIDIEIQYGKIRRLRKLQDCMNGEMFMEYFGKYNRLCDFLADIDILSLEGCVKIYGYPAQCITDYFEYKEKYSCKD